jgi:hypothetical protein
MILVLALMVMGVLFPTVFVARAWAQTAAAATTIDLSPVLQWLLGLLSLGGTALAGIASTLIYAKLGITKDSAAAGVIQAAEQKAGALAYSFIASQGAKITDVKVRNQAIAAGANFMLTEVPGELARLGISQASVLSRAEAELGKLLATDPSVSIGTAAPPAVEAAVMPMMSAVKANLPAAEQAVVGALETAVLPK